MLTDVVQVTVGSELYVRRLMFCIETVLSLGFHIMSSFYTTGGVCRRMTGFE